MAKAAVNDEPIGMEKADLKRLLRLARAEPIQVALALGDDGKAILQMDRRKQARALERQLKLDAPESKSHRWGTATVDPEDKKRVCFTVNKAGGGLARKLIIALKGTGFNKVTLRLDDGTEFEAEEGEDEEEEEEDGDRPAPTRTGEPETPKRSGEPETPTGKRADEPQAEPEAAALAHDLTGLVKRMLAVIAKDSTQKAALAELATDAQASLKRGDLAQASAGIDILREAIGSSEPAKGKAPANGGEKPPSEPDLLKEGEAILAMVAGMVRKLLPMLGGDSNLGAFVKETVAAVQAKVKAGDLGAARGDMDRLAQALGGVASGQGSSDAGSKSGGTAQPQGQKPHPHAPANEKVRQAWSNAREKMQGEIEKLHQTFGSALQGHGMMDELAKTMRGKIDDALQHLDDGLNHALQAVNDASDPAERAKLVNQAHALVKRYQQHVTSNPTIKMLDRNPFHPVAIEQTIVSTLETLAKHIR